MRKILLSLLLIALPVLASAKSNPTAVIRDFKAQARVLPMRLLRMGHSQFGNLDLNDLLQQMGSVEVRIASEDFVGRRNTDPGTTVVRGGAAHWDRSTGRPIIYITPDWSLKNLGGLKPTMALHEYLGALGYQDTNFTVSNNLEFISKGGLETLDESQRENVVRSTGADATVRTAGGVSVVGGAGDPRSAFLRQIMLEQAQARYQNAETEAERRQQAAMIELIMSNSIQLKITYKKKPRGK